MKSFWKYLVYIIVAENIDCDVLPPELRTYIENTNEESYEFLTAKDLNILETDNDS